MIEIFKNIDNYNKQKYISKTDLFLDIETTGVKRYSDYAWCIGICKVINKKIISKQIFLNSKNDEEESLKLLNEELKKVTRIITFNGNTFDLNFLQERAKIYNIELKYPEEKYDLYEFIRKNNKFLMIKRINLQTVEKFMNIKRDDPLCGKDTLSLYKVAVETNYDYVKKSLLNHNYYDIKNLPLILQIEDILKNYKETADSRFIINDFNLVGSDIIVELISKKPIPNINICEEYTRITGGLNFLTISVNLGRQEKNGNNIYYFKDTKKVLKWDYFYYPVLKEKIEQILKKYSL